METLTPLPELVAYWSGSQTLAILDQNNTTELTSYASGIETLRQAMTSPDLTPVTNYASGIQTLNILNQSSLTSNTSTVSGINTSLINLNIYASGIETLRQAMVSIDEPPNTDTAYTRKTGIWETAASSHSHNTLDAGGPNSISATTLQNSLSGIQTLNILNQSNINAVQTYASGNNTQIITNQNAQTTFNTGITAYTSGIETLRRAMVTGGDTTALTAYASGTRTLEITMQGTDTLLNSYASGIETLRRAMVTGGDTTIYASPLTISMLSHAPDSVSGTWAFLAAGSLPYNGTFYNSTHADGDYFTVNVRVPAGTYKLRFNSGKNTNKAIIDVDLDGVEKGSFDMYGTDGPAINEITGLVMDGAHVLKFRAHGKHASSSDHYVFVAVIELMRTGD
jgi:hypothetical protein